MFLLTMGSVEHSKKRFWFKGWCKDWEILPLNLMKMITRKRKKSRRRDKTYSVFSESGNSYDPKPQTLIYSYL